MLKVEISKKLDDFQLRTDFEAKNGITGIIGPSGCGKSLTLQCLAGFQTPDDGKIVLNGRPLYQSKEKINLKPRDRKIGYVFQNYALFPHLTVEKNIDYGLKGRTSLEKKQKVSSMMKKVQLNGYEKHYPHQLSGGQQQRVALARTLITEPDILLLDEPFSALDHHIKHILEQELLGIIRENYSGVVLLVTHNMEEAYRLCDHLILYNNGKVIQYGEKEEVFKRPKSVSAARIIGCKNILTLDSLIETKGFAECIVQGIKLNVLQQPEIKNPGYIGIYPEDIHFVKKHVQGENTFHYEIVDIGKGIHQTNMALKIGHSLLIHASIPNNRLNSLLDEEHKVVLPAENLFLLS